MPRNLSCFSVILRAHFGAVNGIGRPKSREVNRMLQPCVLPSGATGASDSPNSSRDSWPDAHFGAGLQPQPAVARAVAKQLGGDADRCVRCDRSGPAPIGSCPSFTSAGKQGGVEQQRQVRLADDFVVEQQVPQLPAALRIVGRVVEPELFEQAPFAPAGPAAVVVGADDVHLDFARRIAPQPRAVLHQHHLRPRCAAAHIAAQTPARPPPATSTSQPDRPASCSARRRRDGQSRRAGQGGSVL